MEEDASLFTSYTTAPCDYNVTNSVQNLDTISYFILISQKLYHQWEFIHKVNISTEILW